MDGVSVLVSDSEWLPDADCVADAVTVDDREDDSDVLAVLLWESEAEAVAEFDSVGSTVSVGSRDLVAVSAESEADSVAEAVWDFELDDVLVEDAEEDIVAESETDTVCVCVFDCEVVADSDGVRVTVNVWESVAENEAERDADIDFVLVFDVDFDGELVAEAVDV